MTVARLSSREPSSKPKRPSPRSLKRLVTSIFSPLGSTCHVVGAFCAKVPAAVSTTSVPASSTRAESAPSKLSVIASDVTPGASSKSYSKPPLSLCTARSMPAYSSWYWIAPYMGTFVTHASGTLPKR